MRCLRFRGGSAHEGSPLVSNWLCHCCESVHLVNLCSQLCVYCMLCADLTDPVMWQLAEPETHNSERVVHSWA